MKKVINKISTKLVTVAAAALLMMPSCTNLDEKPYSILAPGNYGNSEAQIQTVVGRALNSMRGGSFGDGGNGYIFSEFVFFLTPLSSDEAVLPALNDGADWWDGGRNVDLQLHTWNPQNVEILGAWRYGYNGVAQSNAAIYQIEQASLDEKLKEPLIAEMRALRAFFYFRLLDWFGNVPIVTDYLDMTLPSNKPVGEQRKKVYDFIESELTSIVDKNLLPETGYGRLTNNAAKCLLARLYLNAEVFTGTAEWQKCLNVCNTITGSLAPDYFDNFKQGEQMSCNEIILAVPLSNLDWFDCYVIDLLIPGSVKWSFYNESDLETDPASGAYVDPLPDFPADDWVIAVEPGFSDIFDLADRRIEMIVGDTARYKDGSAVYTLPPSWGGDFQACPADVDGAIPCVLTKDILSVKDRQTREGYGWNKYQLKQNNIWDDLYNAKGNKMFDVVVFRYAEVLLMKAECQVRLGGDAATPFNEVRTRSWNRTVAAPTIQDIEDEYKREFALEDHRRTDMIRFGSFNDPSKYTWDAGRITESGEHTKLFPIPYLELTKNLNLEQNPGYPTK
jgi:hypothetical protein